MLYLSANIFCQAGSHFYSGNSSRECLINDSRKQLQVLCQGANRGVGYFNRCCSGADLVPRLGALVPDLGASRRYQGPRPVHVTGC